MTLFFHLFKVHIHSKYVNGYAVISLWYSTKYFEPFSNSLKTFKEHVFLVVPINKEAHSKNFLIDPDVPS